MKIERTFLHSKLARRIFWLFVLCALIPITVLALVSMRNVTAQLNEESHRQLHQASREQAMLVYEHLNFLEADLKLAALDVQRGWSHAYASSRDVSSGLPSEMENRLTGLELVTPDGNHRLLFGKTPARFEFTEPQRLFLRSGKNVLITVPCHKSEPCILLSRQLDAGHPSEGALVADINQTYLWDADTRPQDLDVIVLDGSGRTLFSSAECPSSFPPKTTQSFSGEFEWKLNGREYIANFWNLPLASAFFVPHWTIVVSRPKPVFLAPLVRFRISYLLVYLLAIWIVLLLSLVQIRRSLIPLAKLKEGTSQLSLGNFRTRVTVNSRDEFAELASSFNFMADRIEKQLGSLKLFNEIDHAILSAWDIEKIVDTLSLRLGQLIAIDLVAVSLIESEKSLSAITYAYDSAEDHCRSKESTRVTDAEMRELAEGPHVSITVVGEDLPNCLAPLTTKGMKHYLLLPVLVESQLSAVLTLGRRSDSPWNDEDKEHARKIADQLAVALANASLVNQLQQLQWGTLTALARAIDAKSPWTLGHSERVTGYAVKIAAAMGLPSKDLDILRRGGLLHDIGKIGIPVEILDKPGKLTDEETKIMREHVNIGARILEPIPGLAESLPIVMQHHEWINGGGYPNGLSGDQVTLHARIFAVADCFDALVSDRPYRPGLTVERAMHIIHEGAGKQFDPNVVEVFQKTLDRKNSISPQEELMNSVVEVA